MFIMTSSKNQYQKSLEKYPLSDPFLKKAGEKTSTDPWWKKIFSSFSASTSSWWFSSSASAGLLTHQSFSEQYLIDSLGIQEPKFLYLFKSSSFLFFYSICSFFINFYSFIQYALPMSSSSSSLLSSTNSSHLNNSSAFTIFLDCTYMISSFLCPLIFGTLGTLKKSQWLLSLFIIYESLNVTLFIISSFTFSYFVLWKDDACHIMERLFGWNSEIMVNVCVTNIENIRLLAVLLCLTISLFQIMVIFQTHRYNRYLSRVSWLLDDEDDDCHRASDTSKDDIDEENCIGDANDKDEEDKEDLDNEVDAKYSKFPFCGRIFGSRRSTFI